MDRGQADCESMDLNFELKFMGATEGLTNFGLKSRAPVHAGLRPCTPPADPKKHVMSGSCGRGFEQFQTEIHRPMEASFTCRTLAPWDEVRGCVVNSAGLRLWMNGLYGEEIITWRQLEGVREWMKGAKEGDVINLSDEGGIVAEGDFEIRCNRDAV